MIIISAIAISKIGMLSWTYSLQSILVNEAQTHVNVNLFKRTLALATPAIEGITADYSYHAPFPRLTIATTKTVCLCVTNELDFSYPI